MPVCVVPVTYNHKEHAILDDARNPADHFDDLYEYEPPVTVADLLDLRAVVVDRDGNHWNDAAAKPHWTALIAAKGNADRAVVDSYNNVLAALASNRRHQEFIAELSPEERAEFDRHTST